MSLIVIVIIVQAVSSTLVWLGFYVGIRWRREHAIANTAKPAVPGSDNVLSPPPVAVNGWNSKEETLSCHNK